MMEGGNGNTVFGDKWVQRDVAIEIMAEKIGICARKHFKSEDACERAALDEELDHLYDERNKMYSGDEQTLSKIFNEYAPEIKAYYESLR